MKEPDHYKDYVGHYVKRFYAPFDEESIWRIEGYRVNKMAAEDTIDGKPFEYSVYLYFKSEEENFWTDCEDSCIITNELPIKDIEWVANVNDPQYKGFNPFLTP